MIESKGLRAVITQEVETVIKLALKREEKLNVLLAEEANSTFVIFDLECFGYVVPSLVFIYLWHSISSANFSVQLVQIQRNIIRVISHWHPQTWRPVLFHEILERIEELLPLRFITQFILLDVGQVSARTSRILDVILCKLRR